MTAGRTDGGYADSAVLTESLQFMTEVCEKLSRAFEQLSLKVSNAIQAALNGLLSRFGPVGDWAADKINGWIEGTLNPMLKKVSEVANIVCREISKNVIPWVMAPWVLDEKSLEWTDAFGTGTAIKGTIDEVNNLGYPISEWQGAGARKYEETVGKQKESANTAANVCKSVSDTLGETAVHMTDSVVGLVQIVGGAITSIVGAIVAITTWETVIGAIAGVIGFLVGIITAIAGAYKFIQSLTHGTTQEIKALKESLAEFAAADGGHWAMPNAAVGSAPGSTMNDRKPWDDGDD